MKPTLFILGLATLLLAGCRSTSSLEAVGNFELQRYTGRWYEVARYPHRFEKGMSNVFAEYSINDDGTVKVVNSGYIDEESRWKSIEGVAKMKSEPDRGWLKVSFFGPFYGGYKIIHLDAAYTEALVVGPTFNYLWILARDPALPKERTEALVDQAVAAGFDRSKIQLVDQTLNIEK